MTFNRFKNVILNGFQNNLKAIFFVSYKKNGMKHRVAEKKSTTLLNSNI